MIESHIMQADDNVFLDLGFSAHEAQSLRIRADLMLVLRNLIRSQNWTTGQAAYYLKTSEDQIQSLMQGAIEQFYVKSLIAMLPHAVMQIQRDDLSDVVQERPESVDRAPSKQLVCHNHVETFRQNVSTDFAMILILKALELPLSKRQSEASQDSDLLQES